MSVSSRLWLALRVSDLPLSALELIGSREKPVVVIQKKKLIYANSLACDAGATVGMDVTTAQLLSGCEGVERNTDKEQLALHTLCEQLYRFTPHIECYVSTHTAQSALLLEVSSCLALFSGLRKMVRGISQFLQQTPHQFSLGLAHTAKAAWLLSFADYDITGDENRPIFLDRLNALPIDLLFDYPKAKESLEKTGFATFGDVARQIEGNSLSSFRKRLGAEFTDVLCEIYDIDQNFKQTSLFVKPRDSYKPDEWFEELIEFEYPVSLVDQLKPSIEVLLQKLCDYLRKRQHQCQYIEWCIADIYRKKEFVAVNSDTPQSHWQLLYDLTLIQFDNKALPFEVDTIALKCTHTMPLQHRSQVLEFDQSRRRKSSIQDFAVTVAKLKARLGNAAVYKIGYSDNRVPELTNVMVALADKCNQDLPDIHLQSLRPTWLLSDPELIEERGARLYWNGYISPLVGPERIIGNWWEQPVARDYYLAKRHDNLPVWIFHNLYDKRWYVHGVFA